MKKIVLGAVALLTVLCGVAQADRVNPQYEAELASMKKWPVEQKIERCKELGSFNMATKRQWLALDCDKLLGKTQETMPNSNDGKNTAEKHEKTEIRIYGFIGLGVLLICAVAFGLLLKTRNKNLPRAL